MGGTVRFLPFPGDSVNRYAQMLPGAGAPATAATPRGDSVRTSVDRTS
jgi:hypothetical protein